MPDIFDKCTRFDRQSRIVSDRDRATAYQVVYRKSPLNNAGPWVEHEDGQFLQFSTNDYLGLASHPALKKAATEIVEKYGVSAPMGARPLTGTIELHNELEKEIADFKRTEKSLVFSNGAFAMMGALAALAGPRDLVVMDRYAHASLVCGAKISGGRIRFFQHNDVEHLEAILLETPRSQPRMVVVDGVYSMQGDIAPLADLCDVCEKHGARLIVDDAHGTGVCGENGRGVAEMLGVEDRIDLHLGTCSKALATTGGFAAGDAVVINYLKYAAPTILFTKAMPACVAAATLESLRLVRQAHDRRKKVWENRALLQDGLRQLGYELGNTQTPITPVHGNGTDAVHMSRALFQEHRIWASAVLYPAVPIGTSILRVIPTANHQTSDIQKLLSAMKDLKRLHSGQASQPPDAPASAPDEPADEP
ncbi:MAG: 8-amino-7-oxononanoate synthase [Planctomycetes bacterium ADurb.Bin126]|nr:MAG: 8-amino-7-oxononanoate synthase [Planctomycetes bacterium ADurb.Bin126]HOD80248.1 pyridoxal phosphate-dependent aminotransferase family protein [Phycisphaerae bacterium]HQL72203.1 pyridoxal phosphate-dependent aminotransferase family protein [Phycisphaerae bacterium]